MNLATFSRRLGWSEGQLYTVVMGTALVAVMATAGSHPHLTSNLAAPPPGTVGSPPVAAQPPVVAVPPGGATPPALPPFGVPAPNANPHSAPDDTAPSALPTPGTVPRVTGPVVFARIGSPGAPGGVAVGSDGHVFVTTDNGTSQGDAGPSKVFEFGPNARALSSVTVSADFRAGVLTPILELRR